MHYLIIKTPHSRQICLGFNNNKDANILINLADSPRVPNPHSVMHKLLVQPVML